MHKNHKKIINETIIQLCETIKNQKHGVPDKIVEKMRNFKVIGESEKVKSEGSPSILYLRLQAISQQDQESESNKKKTSPKNVQ